MSTESILEQYRVHDFVSWNDNRELVLNPHFQRRSVWDAQARSLLIDTLLRRMPIPKVYLRTRLDTRSRRSVRDVVDGQQRLRAILDFTNDEFALSRRTREFAGLRYSDLDTEAQEQLLSYPIAVDSLVNASDSDVLEVFARLNSYTVSLVPAELRHAKYQGDFKWAVHNAARDWAKLWEEYSIIKGRDRLRMGDDSLMAEMYGVLVDGVTDGGASRIDSLYKRLDPDFPCEDALRSRLDSLLEGLLGAFSELLLDTPLSRAPQFLSLFAAYAAVNGGIPAGQLEPDSLALSSPSFDVEGARSRLAQLVEALETQEPAEPFDRFARASSGSTQRIATRLVRFKFFRWALTDESLLLER